MPPVAARLPSSQPRVISYAIDRPADVRPVSVDLSLDGVAFDANTPEGIVAGGVLLR